jgi:hypothetical protein
MMTLWHVARFGDLIMSGMLRFWQPNYPLKDFNGGPETHQGKKPEYQSR